jgi:hypothetical protein
VNIKTLRKKLKKALMINSFIMSGIIDVIIISFEGKLQTVLVNLA